MTGIDERVAVRRKADGKWARKGTGSFAFFTDRPSPLRSRVAATMKMRIDWGLDMDEVDIVPWADVPAEVKP